MNIGIVTIKASSRFILVFTMLTVNNVTGSAEERKIIYLYISSLQDLLDALNQLEQGLKENIKKLSSFEKYKQEVLLGHLDWSPMHKDPIFWRENINNFEENDFQVILVDCKTFASYISLKAVK